MKLDYRTNRIAKIIAEECSRMNINSYLVGGPVRDLCLGKSNIDLDIVVDKDVEALACSLAKLFRSRFVYHHQFKTATVFLDKFNIDIATMREETYPDSGVLPVVKESSLEKDLFRRDFTINSVAIEINNSGLGRIIDPYGGLIDLRQKKIRILHNKSFLDDPTRIIRALRFESRLNFSIEKKTFILLKGAVKKGMLKNVTPLRIGNEVKKLLRENNPFKVLERINRVCGLSFLYPGIKFNPAWRALFCDITKYVANYNINSRKRIEPWIIYFFVLTDNLRRDKLDALLKDYGFKREEREMILHARRLNSAFTRKEFLRWKTPSIIYTKLNPIYPEVIIYLVAKLKIRSDRVRLLCFLRRFENSKLKIGGEDLKKIGFTPGPIFNKVLNALYMEKLDSRLKSRKDELGFIRKKFVNYL